MRRLLGVLLVLGLALAQNDAANYRGLVLTTPYPELTVRAGETVNLSINLQNFRMPPAYLKLRVEGVPKGWTAALLGNGRVVRAVDLPPGGSERLTLRVETPKGAKKGDYPMAVVAEGAGQTLRLPLVLSIGEVLPPSLKLEVELPILKGTPSTTFRYRVTLKNESDQDLLVGLLADAPQGFEVVFKPEFSSQEVTTLPVKAGETKNLDVEVSPPPRAKAGTYPIRVTAKAGEASASLELKAIVTGRPELTITSKNGSLSGRAYAGRATPLKLVIKNRGSAAAKEVELSSFEPSGWEVKFDPKTVPEIAPGKEATVTAQIKPSSKAIAGDYMVTITAKPKNGTSESVDFRITVFTSTVWGVVGVGLVALALVVLVLAMVRFGRR